MNVDPRTGLQILSYDECVGLLTRCPIGRVGIHPPDTPPAILPVNYAYDDHHIVFRTNTNSLLHQADQQTVAFEIDGIDRIYHQGWSVLTAGTLEAVNAPHDIAAYTTLPLGPWAPGPRPQWMRIHPEYISGRCIPPPHANS